MMYILFPKRPAVHDWRDEGKLQMYCHLSVVGSYLKQPNSNSHCCATVALRGRSHSFLICLERKFSSFMENGFAKFEKKHLTF